MFRGLTESISFLWPRSPLSPPCPHALNCLRELLNSQHPGSWWCPCITLPAPAQPELSCLIYSKRNMPPSPHGTTQIILQHCPSQSAHDQGETKRNCFEIVNALKKKKMNLGAAAAAQLVRVSAIQAQRPECGCSIPV